MLSTSTDLPGVTVAVVVVLLTAVAYILFRKQVLPSAWKPLDAGDSLYKGIANLYDTSSNIWETVWGEHMHSGYYPVGVDASSWPKQKHLDAQDEMMRQLLSRYKAPGPSAKPILTILDMGCGVGGSSRFMLRTLTAAGYEVHITGITLSSYQQRRATALSAGLCTGPAEGSSIQFKVDNALHTSFSDATFDLVWSLESGEHMPGKKNWLTEVRRILKPGGTFLCACWCHRELNGQPLTAAETKLLGRICKNYSLPAFVPCSFYGEVAEELGLLGYKESEDSWTKNVLPFWPAVIRSALWPSSLCRMIAAMPFGGWTTVKGAITAYLMMQGFKTGTLNFGSFVVTKPQTSS